MIEYLTMGTLKAGCVLIDIKRKKVGLVWRKTFSDYSFAKGHLEEGETLKECAVRETEEETGRACRIVTDFEYISRYTIPRTGEQCILYMYLAVDEGETKRAVASQDKEVLIWKDIEEVEGLLSYHYPKEFWAEAKPEVAKILKNI